MIETESIEDLRIERDACASKLHYATGALRRAEALYRVADGNYMVIHNRLARAKRGSDG
jgi:hypothetical protein